MVPKYVCNYGIQLAHPSEKEINLMDSPIVAMDTLNHFSHEHPLSIVYLRQLNHKKENEDDEDDEDEVNDEVDFVEEDHHRGQCYLCKEHISSFHLCYYYCKSCDYSLHKTCAELPRILQNHPLHPDHNLFYSFYPFVQPCLVCNVKWENYYACYVCFESICIPCVTVMKQKINHPSHPHQLEQILWTIVSRCVACGNKHEGVFFHCTTCPVFRINLDCALLPTKLLIQNHTDGTFTHSHSLTLAYSFSQTESQFEFSCRICDGIFHAHLWIYKCDKCRYYVHVDCATSKREPFMSILHPARLGKTSINYKEDQHPNLVHYPCHDEGDNLLKRRMSNKKEFIGSQQDGEMLNHSSHQHPLILFDKNTTIGRKTVSLHDPMKRVKLLCDGCVKPIMTVPFYICYQYVDEQCCFVLHEWCAKLPPQIQDYIGHPKHTLFLQPKITSKFFGVFRCGVCRLRSNGFAYGCTICDYYVDINCAFIPEEITHDAHPNHLLSIVKPSTWKICRACRWEHGFDRWGFHCPSCDFYIHAKCALLLPRVVKHKCDRHPLSLRYEPAENHISEYFCEICECELDPRMWFYHCTTCAQSMHAACVPLILQYEQDIHRFYDYGVYKFLNVKFGGTLEIKDHSHRLAFVQGLISDGRCIKCHGELQYEMIFKCLECEFALHFDCASSIVN